MIMIKSIASIKAAAILKIIIRKKNHDNNKKR